MERKSVTNAWNRSGTEILCLEQPHGTEVCNSCMEQIWNGNTLSGTAAWNGSLEQMHGTELELKKALSGTTACNGGLEQMHGTELEPKYFCLEQLHGMEVWNRARTEIYASTNEQNARNMERELIYCIEQNRVFIETLICSM